MHIFTEERATALAQWSDGDSVSTGTDSEAQAMSELLVPAENPATWKMRPLGSSSPEARSQKRDLLAEQQKDWLADHPCPVEHYLERWPTDPNSDPDAASLLVCEIFQRRDRGERPSLDEYAERFPEHLPALGNLIRREDLVRSLGGRRLGHDRLLRLPEVGEQIFGFRLRQPLGRGAFARVYLAEQPELAGRPVVLKISATEGSEHETLARLQHTNIVPIFSVHEDKKAGLRAVCMPYFGGATLSSIMEKLWAKTGQPTRGSQLVEALEAIGCAAPKDTSEEPGGGERLEPPSSDPPAESQTTLTLLRSLGYYRAVAWIAAQLAEGLHHAHQRGILHRDVKPSNILISSEGQPLLLDFNVAHEVASDPSHAVLGGTVAYAAPEHLVALKDCTSDLVQRVDRRSDLYSLGLVLAEMVTGGHLFEQGGSYSARTTQIEAMAIERSRDTPSLRSVRRDVPWSLESIARKCLDPDPARRYQQGDHLAEDLRRFLDDRPLKYAPELSRVEQVQKFFRRHPRLRTTGSVVTAAMMVILVVCSALFGARAHLAAAREQLGEAQARERKHAHDAGAVRALCLVNTTLGRQDHLRQGIAVCEETLALYDMPGGKPFEQHPDWRRLAPEERRQVAEDRRELILLLAGARVRLAKGDRQTLAGALALLDQAEVIPGLGPSKALWLDRASYRSQLGDAQMAEKALRRADRIRATSARERYLLAISYSRQGGVDGYRKAIAELNKALSLQPRHYWSAMQKGICRMELGEYAQAIGDFGTCIGLWPEHPWGYFNRGYVLDCTGMKLDAVNDYTAALERDPRFVAALVNRGLARVELKEYKGALSDFGQALASGDQGDASLHAGRGIALEALGRHAEADAAFQQAFTLAPHCDAVGIRLKWTYGFAVAARLPARAQAAFDDVLRNDSHQPQALYGRAMLAMNRGQLDTALRFFDQALEAAPGFIEARRYRAVVLARQREWERATRDINWCLDREPGSGDTQYAAACVAARAAEASPTPGAVDRAFDLLQRALSLGSGHRAAEDPDLTALRRDPRFKRLITTTSGPDDGNGSGVRPTVNSGRHSGRQSQRENEHVSSL